MSPADPESVHELLLILSPGLPLLLATALLVRGWQAAVFRLMPWAALPALCAVALLPVGAQSNLTWILLQARLGVDATGRVFLFFTALLWLAAGIYARTYLEKDDRRIEFSGFYLMAMSGNLGLILAEDILSFYLFFALMSFSSYGLVVNRRSREASRAGRVYIILVVVGEVLVFTALAMIAKAAASLDLQRVAATSANGVITGLVLLGFGIKAGAFPLHVWLPLAHPVAPTPASAVLSGSMIKAGLLGWLRFLPLGVAVQPEWGAVCIFGGLFGAFYAVVVGLTQSNPKTLLAYSSISQMGYMTVAVGLGLIWPAIWPLALSAVLIYALHHALAKGALFLGVGVAAAASTKSSERRLVAVGLLGSALALAGAPFTSGAVAKAALKSVAALAASPWYGRLGLLLPLGAVGTTLLMARFLYLIWPRRAGHTQVPPGLWLPWAALLAFVAGSLWWWPEASGAAQQALGASKLWSALWPVGLGTALAWVVAMAVQKTGKSIDIQVPAGDILAVAEWSARLPSQDRIKKAGVDLRSALSFLVGILGPVKRTKGCCSSLLRLEFHLGRWTIAGTLLLLLMVAIFLLLLDIPIFSQ